LQTSHPGKAWRDYKQVQTNAAGVYGLKVGHVKDRRFRVRWTAPDGTVYTGPPIRSY
jgi:hypothetical protein